MQLTPSRNTSPRSEKLGASTTVRCTNCKKEGHERIRCWFLYPSLRPKRKGCDGGDQKKKHWVDRDNHETEQTVEKNRVCCSVMEQTTGGVKPTNEETSRQKLCKQW